MQDDSTRAARLQQTLADLAPVLGDRLDRSGEVRDQHAGDACHHAPQAPDAVAFPESNEEVARIVDVCGRQAIPVIPFGAGTGVEGGVVAIHGGICIDMRRMNSILNVEVADADATVQAGVTRYQLNDHLESIGSELFFPVDPGADASLGGMAATCASGSSAVRYGTMRQNVLGLTVVVDGGRVIRTGGRARKSSSGYDLTRLFVGSEGTLGVITEVTLRLARRPQAISAAVCTFGDIDSAVQTVIAVMTAGIAMARIELLDELQMEAVNRYSGLTYPAAPTLFFEFHGTPGAVADQAQQVGEIVSRYGGGSFEWATEASDRKRLWQARYDAFYAAQAMREGCVGYVTDVCVPIGRLAECIHATKVELANTKIPAPMLGHVGDGNYHVVFLIDPDSADELAEVQQINRRIVQHALACGGTCSGEHGIGLGKLAALQQEHGEAVAVMRAIKSALDPQGIFNPGKVLVR